MNRFQPDQEPQILQSIQNALQKALAEGQPVRELAEAYARGKRVECCFVEREDGGVQLLIWTEES